MRRLVACTIALTILGAPSTGTAGNLDSYLLGNTAAMTGGALLAITRGSDAFWYNPAGLGGVQVTTLDLSGSAFVLRVRELSDAVQTTLPDGVRSDDLNSVEIFSVPTALVFVRSFTPTLTGAIGVFVPSQDEFQVSTLVNAQDLFPDDVRIDYDEQLAIRWKSVEYHAGVGLGWQVTPRFRLGFNAFVIYSATELATQFWTHAYDPAPYADPRAETQADSLIVGRQDAVAKAVGGQAAIALQWDITPRWHLGLTVRSPAVTFKVWGEQFALQAAAHVIPGLSSSTVLVYDDTPPDDGLEVVRPARIHLGLARSFDWGWLALEGDIQPAFTNETLDIDTRLIGNARLGAHFDISPTVSAGLGLFTDLSPEVEVDGVGSTRIDYFGLAAGVELKTPHKVAGDPGARPITFSTTFALRYALGIGEAGALRFNPLATDEPEDPAVENLTNPAIFHEVTLHVGSAVHF